MSQRPVHEIESKWQNAWEELGVYRAKNPEEGISEKFYGLIEFPYPSGDGLHVGHPRSYTAIDIYTRKKRMEGKNVLYPIGWDASGLPTENYAIKHKIKPMEATTRNVANFTRQLKSLGFGFDWSREINTMDPTYFKWTQWQFLQFVKAGLAYKAKTTINWCPKDKIGLANEEAQGGVCERCGTPVEKREKEQWMIKITKYADRLLKDLEPLDFLEKIKAQQVNWIGKSEGAEIVFSLNVPGQAEGHKVTVFTTRPDTIFGATFLVVSPELAKKWMDIGWQASEAVKAYVQTSIVKPEEDRLAEGREKTGVDAGIRAVNPVSGEEIPVWIADYVLGGYGTGAIMAVPAHDERDFEFAKKFGLPIKEVVEHLMERTTGPDAVRFDQPLVERHSIVCIVKHWAGDKYLCMKYVANDWQGFTTGGVEEGEDPAKTGAREIHEETGYKNARFVKQLGGLVHSKFYAEAKSVNRFAHFQGMYYELENGERDEVAAEELKIQEPVWVEKNKVEDFLNRADMKVIWHRLEKEELYSGKEGILANSDFLNGLEVAEAQKKVMEILQEKGAGKKATTYKLRDWVFSRQRYWGEPIPLVHCDTCAEKKQKVLLIHGFNSSGDKNAALKKELEAQGFEVFAPMMTTKSAPDFASWMTELEPYVSQLGEDDIVVGHSLGAHAALSVIARQNKKIGSVYLFAPAIGSFEEGYWEKRKQQKPDQVEAIEKVAAFMAHEIDMEKVSSLIDRKMVIWSNDDKMVPVPSREIYPEGWYINQVSDQGHFWGVEPVPFMMDLILQSKNTGWIPVPEQQLPITLPDVPVYEPTDTGESPLANITDWVNTTCPRCHGPAKRETDTMPNWAGSSWYFLRYTDPQNSERFASEEALKYWMPVDLYNGGMEHTTLHLLYSRFWHKFLWDMGHIPHEVGSEPYRARRSHGLILAEGGEKMSKSKGNVVNPDEIVEKYGADVFRVYEMFMGPFDQPVPWDVNGIEGIRRFLDSVWIYFHGCIKAGYVSDRPLDSEVEVLLNQTIKKVGEDIENLKFNTAISKLMILMGHVGAHTPKEFLFQSDGGVSKKDLPDDIVAKASLNRHAADSFLKILAPFAPHLADELWHQLHGISSNSSIHTESWPSYDSSKLQAATFQLVVQVNGKLRDRFEVSSSITEEEAKKQALTSEKVMAFIAGKEPKQVVYVPGRLVNIVL